MLTMWLLVLWLYPSVQRRQSLLVLSHSHRSPPSRPLSPPRNVFFFLPLPVHPVIRRVVNGSINTVKSQVAQKRSERLNNNRTWLRPATTAVADGYNKRLESTAGAATTATTVIAPTPSAFCFYPSSLSSPPAGTTPANQFLKPRSSQSPWLPDNQGGDAQERSKAPSLRSKSPTAASPASLLMPRRPSPFKSSWQQQPARSPVSARATSQATGWIGPSRVSPRSDFSMSPRSKAMEQQLQPLEYSTPTRLSPPQQPLTADGVFGGELGCLASPRPEGDTGLRHGTEQQQRQPGQSRVGAVNKPSGFGAATPASSPTPCAALPISPPSKQQHQQQRPRQPHRIIVGGAEITPTFSAHDHADTPRLQHLLAPQNAAGRLNLHSPPAATPGGTTGSLVVQGAAMSVPTSPRGITGPTPPQCDRRKTSPSLQKENVHSKNDAPAVATMVPPPAGAGSRLSLPGEMLEGTGPGASSLRLQRNVYTTRQVFPYFGVAPQQQESRGGRGSAAQSWSVLSGRDGLGSTTGASRVAMAERVDLVARQELVQQAPPWEDISARLDPRLSTFGVHTYQVTVNGYVSANCHVSLTPFQP